MARAKKEDLTQDKHVKKAGEVWHYHYRLKGHSHHGSTRC